MATITKQELLQHTDLSASLLDGYDELHGFDCTLTVEGRGNLRMGHLGIPSLVDPHTHYLPELPSFKVLIGRDWVKTFPKMTKHYKNALSN